MLDNEQRNKNILARFDTEVEGTSITKYRVVLNDRSLTMINMDGLDFAEAALIAKQKFGERMQSIYAC
jgi:hypothetical protein|tara:strand:+ start:172 stop:375 length:204 start_codon:yes stop_codon:yes gene_type:complete